MLEAFRAGGDFHSRTALGMFPHVREAVDQGQVLLEWDPQPGQERPPVPLLKDRFRAERQRAKVLNFSLAYGKTPHGLAKDWGVSSPPTSPHFPSLPPERPHPPPVGPPR